ncbi:TonB-dependent receptor [Vibrio tasmaniensis]|uniref:TonB-dependent receptor n=1 Tax=Vibrio tasmaniensis TaxID=212663 RepID=UPI001117F8C3|nr:TonB-dependent receptor [Vibrio tasmaniensis]
MPRKHKAKYASLLILAVQAPLTLAAQTSEIETMVIESSRIDISKKDSPQSVTIITREQIEQQLSISTDSSQVLSNLLPGYALNTQKLNNSSQTFRGRDVLYMVDGVPQSNSLRKGSRAAHTIDLSMVERIEVIKGASAIHGLGATGGIINFITKTNRSDEVNHHFNIQMTSPTTNVSSDTQSYKANYQIEGATDNFDYLVGLTGEVQGVYLDANGDYVGAATVRGDIMDSRSYDFMTKIGYWIDDEQDIEFLYNRYQLEGQMNYTSVKGDRDKGVATSSVKGTPKGSAPSNIVQTFSMTYTNNDFMGMKLSSQGFFQDFSGRYGASTSRSFQDPSTAETIYDQSQNESQKIGAKFNLSKNNLFDGKLNATAGLDLLKDTTSQKLILTGRTYVPETTYVNYAPFIQLTYNPVEILTIQAGARYENAELDIDTYQTVAARNGVTVQGGKPSFSDTVYNAGAVLEVFPSVRLFANYSQGFGMPDVGRVLRGVKKPGQKVDDLIDLSPIVTDNYEGGLRFNNDSIDFEISYYISNSELGSRIVENNGLYTVKREKKEIKGFETSLGYSLSDSHNLDAGYSFIKGSSDTNGDGTVDKKLTGADIPANKLRLAWTAQWSNDLTSMIQANHAFDRTFDDKELEFKGYTLVDATLAHKLPIGSLSVAVANLFNEDYFTYYSQSAYKNDNFYFKGRGRTLTLAYKVDF